MSDLAQTNFKPYDHWNELLKFEIIWIQHEIKWRKKIYLN